MRVVRVSLWVALVLGMLNCVALAAVDERPLDVRVVTTFDGLQWPDTITGESEGKSLEPRPLIITGAGDGSNRMFAATEYGTIHVFKNDPAVREMKTFLDIRERVMPFKVNENEEGFLGLAFHPKYKENGEFFVYYTAKPTEKEPHLSVISRFRRSKDDPDRADPNSEEILMTIHQPYWNHNGGTLVFGPDGMLYIGLGDGGWGGDPHKNGQNLQTLLGKILRIDVDHKDDGLNYAIPPDNPYANQQDKARGEIWASGIRNVWRITFDRETGTMWGADVGQDTWEEIDIIKRGGNYGWNLREGMHPYGPEGTGPSSNLTEPILEYNHSVGKSVTGGYVYRGKRVPELRGAYLYADYVTGQVWALWYDEKTGAVTANRTIQPNGLHVMTFGEDDDGEVYFTSERQIFTFQPSK